MLDLKRVTLFAIYTSFNKAKTATQDFQDGEDVIRLNSISSGLGNIQITNTGDHAFIYEGSTLLAKVLNSAGELTINDSTIS